MRPHRALLPKSLTTHAGPSASRIFAFSKLVSACGTFAAIARCGKMSAALQDLCGA
jgi:hypothetical protein